jgi:Short C-terminal domain
MILIRRPNPDEVNVNLSQEVDRLAKLHAEGKLTTEEFTKAKAQLLSAPTLSTLPVKGIRRESTRKFCGLPSRRSHWVVKRSRIGEQP